MDASTPPMLKDVVAVIDAVTRGLRAGEAEFGVTVNQILCSIAWRPEWADQTVELAAARQADFPCAIVGFDVAAGEVHLDKVGHPELHVPQLEAARKARSLGLHVTIHAGEEGGAPNVLRAVDEYGAERIGHGYSAANVPALLAKLVEKGVHFECCPTSSVETGAWAGAAADALDWPRHPIRTLIEAGASVSLNSDDPTVFETTLGEELHLAREMGLSTPQVAACTLNALDAAFIDEAEKRRLRVVITGQGIGNASAL